MPFPNTPIAPPRNLRNSFDPSSDPTSDPFIRSALSDPWLPPLTPDRAERPVDSKAISPSPLGSGCHHCHLAARLPLRNLRRPPIRARSVDATGNVDFAKAISAPAEFFSQAENLEAKRKFKPFSRDGNLVRASFSDYVSIVPPEIQRKSLPYYSRQAPT